MSTPHPRRRRRPRRSRRARRPGLLADPPPVRACHEPRIDRRYLPRLRGEHFLRVAAGEEHHSYPQGPSTSPASSGCRFAGRKRGKVPPGRKRRDHPHRGPRIDHDERARVGRARLAHRGGRADQHEQPHPGGGGERGDDGAGAVHGRAGEDV